MGFTINPLGPPFDFTGSGGGGGGTPGDPDTAVQFNDAGSFGGDAGLTYDKTENALTVTGDLQTGVGPYPESGEIRLTDVTVGAAGTHGIWGTNDGDDYALLRLTLGAGSIPQITLGDTSFQKIDFALQNDLIIPSHHPDLGTDVKRFGTLFGQGGNLTENLDLVSDRGVEWNVTDASIVWNPADNLLLFLAQGPDGLGRLRLDVWDIPNDTNQLVPVEDNAQDFGSPSLQIKDGYFGTSVTLGENASLKLNPAASADGKFTGITITGTAGTALAFGDLIYLAVADSRWELTDADSVVTCGAVMTGMCVLAAAGDGSATTILLQGIIRADSKFPTLTVGAPVYASTTTGAIQVAAPSSSNQIVQVVGYAMTADEIYFNPSSTYLTVA